MDSATRCAGSWFGTAQLGDKRRTMRLVEMAEQAMRTPAGRITQVFTNAAARQAAYDVLEHDSVSPSAVSEALFTSTAVASSQEARILVPIDGSSLSMVDEGGTKGFGHVGNFWKGARGLKVISALALTCEGTPIGLADQFWWLRQQRADSNYFNPNIVRESAHWEVVVKRVVERFAVHAPSTTVHFLADREADATKLLRLLLQTQQEFTIRSNGTRQVLVGTKRRPLLRTLGRHRPLATMMVSIPATKCREARVARLEIRAALMPIVWHDRFTHRRCVSSLTVVWARERLRTAQPIEWLLLTNVETKTAIDACNVVRRYTHRWRIEDFHKTWKTGACNVENTQLRSPNAVIKWATILGAVAARIERLRRRAREEPSALATSELSTDEIDALICLRSETSKITLESISPNPTILEATVWIAELGGYVNTRKSAPPGATTLARGFERVQFASQLLATLRASGRLR